MNADELGRSIERMKIEMMEAAKQMDFMEAARLRDEIIKMEQHLQTLDK
jgi:excinuclease ABC subunit B